MSDSMSTPATHAFEAEVEAGPSSLPAPDVPLSEAFDIDETVKVILEGGYKTIGLQFPDDLLPSSVAVYRAIQGRIADTEAQAYVLADSTYGACCPDVLSCLHLPADLLVHYGHACLTPTDALPVHYVFPRQHLDPATAFEELNAITDWEGKSGVVLVWDVAYDWLQEDIEAAFSKSDRPISFARICRPGTKKTTEKETACEAATSSTGPGSCGSKTGCCSSDPAQSTCSTSAKSSSSSRPAALRSIVPPEGLDLDACVLWYLGPEGRSLLNVQMTHSNIAMYAYDDSARQCTGTSRLLARRLFAVHQALNADVYGLVVGNVGLASSRPLLAELRSQLAKKGKKSYTLSVGRLNPAKLANFADIECFVLVGCAEGGVVDSKDFLRPIITPYELTLALSGADWDPSKWTLDLGSVLESAKAVEAKEPEEDDELEFSLVTGTYRPRKVYTNGAPAAPVAAIEGVTEGVKDLTLRGEFTLAKLESAGSSFLASRSFQGLEPRYGLDEPAVLEQGRSGIARGYTEEKE